MVGTWGKNGWLSIEVPYVRVPFVCCDAVGKGRLCHEPFSFVPCKIKRCLCLNRFVSLAYCLSCLWFLRRSVRQYAHPQTGVRSLQRGCRATSSTSQRIYPESVDGTRGGCSSPASVYDVQFISDQIGNWVDFEMKDSSNTLVLGDTFLADMSYTSTSSRLNSASDVAFGEICSDAAITKLAVVRLFPRRCLLPRRVMVRTRRYPRLCRGV